MTNNRDVIEIFPPVIHRMENDIRLSVDLAYQGRHEELWYQFPAEYEAFVSTEHDPFVIAVLFLAMEKELDIKAHGTVSQSLIDNLERFQEIWHKWDSQKYKKCMVFADVIAEPCGPEDEHVVMMFSGGLDSCYTAWKHAASRKKPQSALFVLGFDIPLEEDHFFDSYFSRAQAITDSVGIKLIPLRCNFRQIIGSWVLSHGTALASCLHLFSGLFTTGLIASSHAYDSLRFPWGSNPLTDPLLSSDRLQIVNDGGECSRWEKAEAVADWQPAMNHLRVCYQGKQKDRNCGVCSNCLLTAVAFASAGRDIPSVLNVSTIDQAVQQLYALPLKPVGIVRVDQMIMFAKTRGINAPWLKDLRTCSRFHKKRLKLAKPLGKLMLWNKKVCGAGCMTSPKV